MIKAYLIIRPICRPTDPRLSASLGQQHRSEGRNATASVTLQGTDKLKHPTSNIKNKTILGNK